MIIFDISKVMLLFIVDFGRFGFNLIFMKCWTIPYMLSCIMYHFTLQRRDSSHFEDKSQKGLFGGFQFSLYSNDFKNFILFSNFVHYAVVACSEIRIDVCLFQHTTLVLLFSHLSRLAPVLKTIFH